MIVTCNNCNKKFKIELDLIPEKGRLLQCNGCNHKWFFKKDIITEPAPSVKINIPSKEQEFFKTDINPVDAQNHEVIEVFDTGVKDNFVKKEISIKDKDIKLKVSINKKNYNILGLTIVFIISFIAFVIFLDTFQGPLSSIIPNIEFLLYSLYETTNDIRLFFKDLI